MDFFTLAARCARVVPDSMRGALPLLMMAAYYWASSLPGVPLPEDPEIFVVFYWISPTVQNALHVPAYAALSCAWHWTLAPRLRRAGTLAAAAIALAVAYGALDEWHQSFVPGRYASLADVAFDAAGAALGAWLAGRVRRAAAGTAERRGG